MDASDQIPGADFASWRSYWNFAYAVRRQDRYMRTPETEAFLKAVRVTCHHRKEVIPAGALFWRAQAGNDWRRPNEDDDVEIACAHPSKRMKPLPYSASEGRANPRGIPCLYVATAKETAMSEVRPWVGSYVSVGQFRMLRELKVVNCSRLYTGFPFFFEEPEAEKRHEMVWRHIDQGFAEPTTRSDDHADYAPTQVLAELFRHEGYDGVAYRSTFGENGFNIALFDPAVATIENCGLFQVERVDIKFKEADAFYFVAKDEEATPPAG